ncbi:MAG: rhodanese-like domain-containing protein [Alphaproteobacteria bacterium]|nr:rhodanese-like domain-containing protein [Alphaproteobacteria bacterium]
MIGKLARLPLRMVKKVARRIQADDARRNAEALSNAPDAPRAARRGPAIPEHELADLDPAEITLPATQLMGDDAVCFVDVRPADAGGPGLPDAMRIPVEELVIRLAELPAGQRVVVFDGGDGVAERAALFLRNRGLVQVFVMGGGLPAWQRAGGPVDGA